MDANSSKAWCKLHNITNETNQKILSDKAYIKNYKQKCEELNKEISLMKEQSESYSKVNVTLENQVKQLKESHEQKIKDLPFYSNVCNRLKKQAADAAQSYQERETYLKGILSADQKKYEDLVDASDAVWPECKQLKQEREDLEKLQLDLKILQQSVADEREKIELKKDIQQKLFNSAIVDFVTRIRDQKENQKVIQEIERYTRDGKLLLKEYEKAVVNAEKKKMNDEFSQHHNLLKFGKDDLPEIEKKQTLSLSSSTSSLLNVYSSKFSQNNEALERYNEREKERKKRLQKIANQSLLHKRRPQEPKSQPSPQNPPIEKVRVLDQVFMSPATGIKSKPLVTSREPKMHRLSSGPQFGSQGDKKEVNRVFGKPQEAEAKLGGFAPMQSKQFTSVSESARTSFTDRNLKSGESSGLAQYASFGGFSRAFQKEQQKPQVEKAPGDQTKKAGVTGKKRSFEEEELSFFSNPKTEQKKTPSPSKIIAGDEVFKIPKPYDTSFDFKPSFNQSASADEAPNMTAESYDLPICFSPSYENDAEPEPMFSEKGNSSDVGSFFFFQ